MSMKSSCNNFTLIELMVVMIIMTILFAITVPALMSVQSAQGVETSARKLQAVMINTRALAAKYNALYSVVFSAVNPNDGGSASNTAEDHWYAVIGHSADGDYPSTAAGVKSRKIGPRYYLGNGAKWRALTYTDGTHLWSDPAYNLPASQGTEGFDSAKDVRISFMPTGEALFKMPTGYDDENDIYQTIVIAKDGDEDTVYLRLVVNKYSGNVVIKKK